MAEENKQKKGVMIFLIVLIIILAIVIIWQFAKPSIQTTGNIVSESNQQSLQDEQQSCRNVQVPYDYLEEYPETVPYIENIPLVYEDGINHISSDIDCSDFGNYKKCWYIDVMNLDSIGGIFAVNCDFRTLKRTLSDTDSNYIKPGDTVTFRCVADVDMGEDVEITYVVSPPTKEETNYKEVTKTRTVTRYKTEEKCD